MTIRSAPRPGPRARSAVDWRALISDGAKIEVGELAGSLLVTPLDSERDVVVLMVPVATDRTEAVKGVLRQCLNLVDFGRFVRRLGAR